MLASLSGAAPKSSRASSLLQSGHIFGRPGPRRCDCGCKRTTCRSELAREPFQRSPEDLARQARSYGQVIYSADQDPKDTIAAVSAQPVGASLLASLSGAAPKSSRGKLAPTVRSCTWPVQRGLVLAEADAIAERIMDFQHLAPALLNNLGASVAVAFALQFVLQQLDIVHRHKDR